MHAPILELRLLSYKIKLSFASQNYEKSLQLVQELLQGAHDTGDIGAELDAYEHSTNVNLKLDQINKAEKAAENFMRLALSLKSVRDEAVGRSLIAKVQLAKQEQELATRQLTHAAEIQKDIKDYTKLVKTHELIGQVELQKQNYQAALLSFNQGVNLSKKQGIDNPRLRQYVQQTKNILKRTTNSQASSPKSSN